MARKINILGDVRAEADGEMLDRAFYESPDYLTMLESDDRSVVVGRRGTGKSALCYKLLDYWKKQKKTRVLSLSLEEDQVIGLREIVNLFGRDFGHIKAGTRILWRYALMMEAISSFANHYKFSDAVETAHISAHVKEWGNQSGAFAEKARRKLKSVVAKDATAADRVADLATNLELRLIEDTLRDVLDCTSYIVVILVDRLDEGYEPDDVGVALVDGFVQAAIDLTTKFDPIRATVFLRDNIFRAVASKDPDYSRNIEGQVLRLHWDEQALFYMICKRIATAFGSDIENNRRLWDRFTSNELQGADGFKQCLRHTLYRPRDTLILLNNAFYNARKQGRERIIKEDIASTSEAISCSRLDDLHKEYFAVFPSLRLFTAVFMGGHPKFSVEQGELVVSRVLEDDIHPPSEQQDIRLFTRPIDVIQQLYSIGFIGVKDRGGLTIFCHDGRTPDKELSDKDELLIHPCYWIALNLSEQDVSDLSPEEIYDEYEIEVTSDAPALRNRRIGQLISDLDCIPQGIAGATRFEGWALDAIRIIFAGALRNPQLHPNKASINRRDVVATNLSETKVWERIYNDYKSRQIVFEVKNYEDLSLDEYRQMLSYLTGEYGRLGFFITRKKDFKLTKQEVGWTRAFYFEHNVLIIKLSAREFAKLLSKQRSPQKFSIADKELNKLLDVYVRDYLSPKHDSTSSR